ncbi:heterokaryon incompatibility protein-domain-containing protein [Aspergillus cavernicola]|uniref:Heterokaryon incompatibility protein-domain-containing protein n=1 Tax=Aspergillus cavernicola TaxID=176166 RepID=A0ABR4ILH6_9EURO
MEHPSDGFYSELRRGQFRLLTVHEGQGNDELHCTLQVRTLYRHILRRDHPPVIEAPDPEPYDALSYSWGSFEPRHCLTIIHNNYPHTVQIFPNLKAALLQLRDPHTPRSLWVDALCINQRDETEKSGQVKEMTRIYNNARGVCVWLGEADRESTRAIDFIRYQLQQDDSDSLMEDEQLAGEWAALSRLIRRPWFSRRWIIQEIALARSATVHCGPESMPWDDFADAIALFVHGQPRIQRACRNSKEFKNDSNYLGDLGESAAARLVNTANSIFIKSHDGGILDRRLSLEELMCALHIFETSDPRDALYAIISIASDARPGFKISDEAEGAYGGDYVSLSPLSSSPNADESLSPVIPTHLHPHSASIESRTGNGNLGATLSANSGRKRAFSDTGSHDGPFTRLKVDESSSEFISASLNGINADSEVPAIVLEVIQPSPTAHQTPPPPGLATRGTSIDRLNERVQSPFRPQVLSLNIPRSRGSFSSVSSSRADDAATKAAKRWCRNYRDHHIPVDYTKSLYEVCVDVLNFTFKASNSLDMICRPWAPTDLSLQPLPSWIPTTSKNSFGLAKNGVCTRVNADPLVGGPGPGPIFYRAAKSTPALWQFDESDDGKPCLIVTGFVLGTISMKTSPAISGVIPGEWTEAVQWTNPSIPPPQPFWQTLVGDRNEKGERPGNLWKKACQMAFGYRPQLGDLNVTEVLTRDLQDHVRKYLERVQRTVWSRRLAVLSDGSLLLVPRGAKKGDQVCIINGCSVPILLHQVESRKKDYFGAEMHEKMDGVYEPVACYRMIGECYVHGMMDGEAPVIKRRRGIRNQWFYLI